MSVDPTRLPPVGTQLGSDPDLLVEEIKRLIATQIDAHPRSLQTRLGPSEIGDPCARRLAHKLLATPKARTLAPAWRPVIGTAVHGWLEDALAADNREYVAAVGGPRWLVETAIDAGPMAGTNLTGHSDAYDRITQTAIDWKIIGPSAHKKLRADINTGRGPRREYVVQLHTYGAGYVRRGLPVARVMLVALPAAGELDDALHWCAPWDAQIAADAMARVDRIHALTTSLGPVALTLTGAQLDAAHLGHLRPDPDSSAQDAAIGMDSHGCRFCPYLNPGSTDPAAGCPGALADARDTRLEALIA